MDAEQPMTSLERLQSRPIVKTMDEEMLKLVASQIAPGCSVGELGFALELAARYDLDPFAKEIWCTKSEARDGRAGKLLIMVGRDGLRKIAQRQGFLISGDAVREQDEYSSEYVGSAAEAREGEWEAYGRAPFNRVVHRKQGMGVRRGAVIGAWCRVTDPEGRQAGWFEAPIEEYRPTSEAKLRYSPWGSQESVMILAAAERQALRQATPLGGLLAEGEDARVGGDDPAGQLDDDARIPLLEALVPADSPLRERLVAAAESARALGMEQYSAAVLQMNLMGQPPERQEAFIAEMEAAVKARGDIPDVDLVEEPEPEPIPATDYSGDEVERLNAEIGEAEQVSEEDVELLRRRLSNLYDRRAEADSLDETGAAAAELEVEIEQVEEALAAAGADVPGQESLPL